MNYTHCNSFLVLPAVSLSVIWNELPLFWPAHQPTSRPVKRPTGLAIKIFHACIGQFWSQISAWLMCRPEATVDMHPSSPHPLPLCNYFSFFHDIFLPWFLIHRILVISFLSEELSCRFFLSLLICLLPATTCAFFRHLFLFSLSFSV